MDYVPSTRDGRIAVAFFDPYLRRAARSLRLLDDSRWYDILEFADVVQDCLDAPVA